MSQISKCGRRSERVRGGQRGTGGIPTSSLSTVNSTYCRSNTRGSDIDLQTYPLPYGQTDNHPQRTGILQQSIPSIIHCYLYLYRANNRAVGHQLAMHIHAHTRRHDHIISHLMTTGLGRGRVRVARVMSELGGWSESVSNCSACLSPSPSYPIQSINQPIPPLQSPQDHRRRLRRNSAETHYPSTHWRRC